jgi:hypothetical protein
VSFKGLDILADCASAPGLGAPVQQAITMRRRMNDLSLGEL